MNATHLAVVTVGGIWGSVWPILVAILGFGLLIFVHELGHFLGAKSMGIRVNEFALGFGPPLVKFTRGETLYAIRLLPIGGYCKMEGEDEESEDERSFGKKPVWRRMIVIVAGAVFNIILGFLLMMIYLSTVQGFYTTTVSSFASGTISSFAAGAASEQSGLKVGDQILAIDNRSVYSFSDIAQALQKTKDGAADVIVLRDGKQVDLPKVKFETQKQDGQSHADVDFTTTGATSNQSGLQAGDKILSINNHAVYSFSDITYILLMDKDGAVNMAVRRAGQTVELPKVQFEMVKQGGQSFINVDFENTAVHKTVGTLLQQTFLRTVSVARLIWMTLGALITGQLGANQLMGPLGTISAIGQGASQGFSYGIIPGIQSLSFLLCLITVNLGIFNLLPVPALDGGRFVFLLLELLRRKPVSAKYEGWVHAAGFALVILLIIFITYGDIVRLIRGG